MTACKNNHFLDYIPSRTGVKVIMRNKEESAAGWVYSVTAPQFAGLQGAGKLAN